MDILSILGAFAVIILVLVLTYKASRWYARRMGGAIGSGKYIKFHDRAALGGGNASLVITQVGEEYYLLGISDHNVQLICKLDAFDPDAHLLQQQPSSFGKLFGDMLRKGKPQSGEPEGGDE